MGERDFYSTYSIDKIKQISPTIVVEAALLFLWIVILGAAIALYQQPFYYVIPLGILQGFVVFLFFTPIHDGTHFLISRKRYINDIAILLLWPVFLANPLMFRRIHLNHHAHTNDDAEDPDHFTSSRYLSMRLLKSLFLAPYYHVHAWKNFHGLRWKAHILASALSPVVIIYIAVMTPFTAALLWAWVLPAFIATGILAYVNTSWPHHPARESTRYRNTRNTYVPWVVQALMLNQNLHLVHHVRPSLPWYKYPTYLKQHESEFLKNGAQTIVYTRREEPYALVPEKIVKLAKEVIDGLPLNG